MSVQANRSHSRLAEHGVSLRGLAVFLVGALMIVSLLGFVIEGVSKLYYRLPHQLWGSYLEVVPVKTNKPGLWFYSTRDIRKEVKGGGLDTLYCKTKPTNQYGNYSAVDWKKTLRPTHQGGKWRYPGAYPPDTDCCLDSEIYYYPHPSHPKSQLLGCGPTFKTPTVAP